MRLPLLGLVVPKIPIGQSDPNPAADRTLANSISVAGTRSSRIGLSFIEPYYPKCLLGNTFQVKQSLGCSTLPIHCYAIGLQGIGHIGLHDLHG